MQPIEMSDPAKIEEFLSKICLGGKGFTTECLLVDTFEAGLDYPDYLKAEGEDPDADALSYIHQNKTAALLVACMEMGLSLGEREGDDDVLTQGRRAGLSLGLAFQAMDDFLDATRTTEQIGKDANSDAARKKATLVALRGLEETRELASRYTDDALAAVRDLGGDNEFLLALILYLLDRQK